MLCIAVRYLWVVYMNPDSGLSYNPDRSHSITVETVADIEISSWKVLSYGIYARINLFSQNERAIATSKGVLRKQINKCVNAIRKHFS